MQAVPPLAAIVTLPWEIVPRITQPLALLALVVVALLAWRVHSMAEDSKRLELLPDDRRSDLATQLASKYGVRVDDLPRRDRVEIVRHELDTRTAERRRTSWQIFAAFVLLLGLSIAGQQMAGGTPASESAREGSTATTPPTAAPATDDDAFPFTPHHAWDVKDTIPEGFGVWLSSLRRQPNPAAELQDVTLVLSSLEWGEYSAGGASQPAVHATLDLHNFARPGSRPVKLALRPDFFRLTDDAGRSAGLLWSRLPSDALEPGQWRTLHVIFDDRGWHGKQLQARRIDLEVRGLLPILSATWSFRPLVTAADAALPDGGATVLHVASVAEAARP